MDTTIEWVYAPERSPDGGMPVAAAITGRYPDGEDFWLVRPMVFIENHIDDDGVEHGDCFVDSDGIVRYPLGRPCAEPVTHWAYLPTLPGRTVSGLFGADAREAVRHLPR